MIPYGRQDITQADIDAVAEVLRSDFLTQGPQVPAFEEKLARRCSAEYAVASNSATSSLHIACLALGLGPGDRLWTVPNTFVASANCGLYCGAEVDFVDIDPDTYNLCPFKLEQKLRLAETRGELPKIVIPVHHGGNSCDMRAIAGLAQRYGFKVIEDASHAIGGAFEDSPVGNCRYSDITIFSFHPVKIITTAEGGMATTNCEELASKMRLYRSHGITRDSAEMAGESDGPWYYQQIALGFNYRMTELQAALGLSQLERLDTYVTKRNALAQRYHQLLGALPLKLPRTSAQAYSAWHLYVVRVDQSRTSCSRLDVFNLLREADIGVNVHYIPVHRQPYYQSLGFEAGQFPQAESFYDEAISLPLYFGLTEADQDYVVSVLTAALQPSQVTRPNRTLT